MARTHQATHQGPARRPFAASATPAAAQTARSARAARRTAEGTLGRYLRGPRKHFSIQYRVLSISEYMKNIGTASCNSQTSTEVTEASIRVAKAVERCANCEIRPLCGPTQGRRPGAVGESQRQHRVQRAELPEGHVVQGVREGPEHATHSRRGGGVFSHNVAVPESGRCAKEYQQYRRSRSVSHRKPSHCGSAPCASLSEVPPLRAPQWTPPLRGLDVLLEHHHHEPEVRRQRPVVHPRARCTSKGCHAPLHIS